MADLFGLGDILYPDNPKREKRAEELGNDITNLVHDLSEDADKIKTTLQELDSVIRELYQSIQVNLPSSATKEYNYNDWTINVIEKLQPLINLVPNDLHIAGVSFLFVSGINSDKSLLEKVVGVPEFIGLTPGVGGVAALALDLLGAFGEKRDKLRHAIHSSISSRLKVKKSATINRMLAEKLGSVKTSMETLKKYGYTQEELDKAQKKVSDEFSNEVSKVSDATVKAGLADLDKNRGSWTNEDN